MEMHTNNPTGHLKDRADAGQLDGDAYKQSNGHLKDRAGAGQAGQQPTEQTKVGREVIGCQCCVCKPVKVLYSKPLGCSQ
eukprot:1138475-Pelagomonas_calceolata.AAC.8